MKLLAKTLVWLVLLVLAIGGIAREYLLRAWAERDDVLKQQVVDKLRELFPDAHVQVDDVKYDFGRDVVISGFELKPKGQSLPIVRLPQTVVHIDRDALIERQQLDVRKVAIRSPKLELVRDRVGNWNWQSLLPLPEQEKGSLPEITIEDGTVTVRVEQALGIPSGALTLEHVDIRLVPSGKRQFRIEAVSRCEHTGQIELSGRWHVDEQTGQIDGQLTEITAGQELLGLAASFAPDIRAKLEDWEAKLAELLSRPADPQSGLPFSVSLPHAANDPNASGRIGSADSIFGLRATANVGFSVSRPEAGQTPLFHVWMGVKNGEITNPILPFPLQNLRGELYVDNDSFKVTKLTAHDGTTKVLIDGALKGRDAGYPGKFEVMISNMLCDARLRSRLSIGFGRIYDAHHPTGDLDLHCFVVHDHEGRWRPEGLIVTAKDCSVAHDSFPYPIENANGTIEQQGRDLIIDMQGTASGRPITLKGTVSQPGPNSTMVLDVECNDLPLDETFLRACKPELQAAIRKMQLTGVIDGKVRLTKAPREPIVPRITALLREGSIVYEAFPYGVDNLTGRLSATGNYWEFHEVTGRHGTAVLTADGSYAKLKDVGELKLKVITQQAPLDETLFRAMPASLKRVWREFSLTGMLDVVTDIHWLTDRSADIRMPRVALSNGSLTLKTLPYRLDDVQASFAYGLDKDGLQKLSVQSLEGRHAEMTTSVSGYQKMEPNGDWRVHLEKFTIENLTPNDEFLKSLAALPGLRQVFGLFDPNQTLRMDGVMELRGTPDPNDPITAAWDLDTFFSGGTIHTGLDFKDLHGRVRAKGDWDGQRAKMSGLVDLKSARILDYVLDDIRGPFRVKDGVLMFGAGDTQRTRPPESLKPSERLTAKLFDGVVLLDGAATLTEQPEYQVLISLQNARLERFAALHAPKQRNLRGITNGRINLRGKGSSPQDVTGNGQIQISPAALLNLPVVLQMYRSLSLAEPEESTFSYAMFDFNIKDTRFNFDRIFLEGDSVSFRGRGSVGFDSSLNLNFYSMLPRNQVPIPIVHEILGEATKGWVGIKVRGKLSQPETRIEAVPLLEPALKNFLGILPQPLLPIGQGLRPRGLIRN